MRSVVLSTVPPTMDLTVWVAVTDEERSRGLQGVAALPFGMGMLFVFPAAQHVGMWMRDTLIPLDIVFLRYDWTVSGIVYNAQPRSDQVFTSSEPVPYVLEVPYGTASLLELSRGAQLRLRY